MHYSGRQIVANSERTGIPLSNIEKIMVDDYGNIIGRKLNVMTKNLEEATEAFETATKTILQSSDAMHAQMDSLSKRAKDSIGRAKDMSAQMTDAMNKVTKLVGPDFEKRLDQLEQLTKCLERLSLLNESGKLAPMLAALNATTSSGAAR